MRRTSRSVFCARDVAPARRACSGSSPSMPPASSPSEPRMEVSGVRSSWLTMETNSSFIRSTSRRSVTSRKVTTAPVMLPSSSIGVLAYSTGNDAAVRAAKGGVLDLAAHPGGRVARTGFTASPPASAAPIPSTASKGRPMTSSAARPQHAAGGGVQEEGVALRVDAVDPLRGGFQDELVLPASRRRRGGPGCARRLGLEQAVRPASRACGAAPGPGGRRPPQPAARRTPPAPGARAPGRGRARRGHAAARLGGLHGSQPGAHAPPPARARLKASGPCAGARRRHLGASLPAGGSTPACAARHSARARRPGGQPRLLHRVVAGERRARVGVVAQSRAPPSTPRKARLAAQREAAVPRLHLRHGPSRIPRWRRAPGRCGGSSCWREASSRKPCSAPAG